ncbi:hypothetical protein WJX82_003084 [Trebouxia sp. C0006]
MTSCWAAEENCCVHCKHGDIQQGFGPRTFILCVCCQDRGSHVECEEKATGLPVSPQALEAGNDWFCSQDCSRVSLGLAARSSQGRMPFPGDTAYSSQLVKYDSSCKGSQNATDAALRIFRSCFDPLEMDDGKELIEMVCTSYESPDDAPEDDQHDFSNFRVLLVRKNATLVSVATLRVFGNKFAEMPFVATKEGYRREGNCKRLLKVVEDILVGLRVQWLVVPSVKSLVGMWTRKFSFIDLSMVECDALEDRIVTPDTSSATMLKKKIYRTPAEAAVEAAAVAAAAKPAKPRGRPRKLIAIPAARSASPSASKDPSWQGPVAVAAAKQESILGVQQSVTPTEVSKPPDVNGVGAVRPEPQSLSLVPPPAVTSAADSEAKGPAEPEMLAPGVPLPADWKVTTKPRADGHTDKNYHAPDGRRFRTKTGVAQALGITLPGVKASRKRKATPAQAAKPVQAMESEPAQAASAQQTPGSQQAAMPIGKRQRQTAPRQPPLPARGGNGAALAPITPGIMKMKLELEASNAIADAVKKYVHDSHLEAQHTVQAQQADIHQLELQNLQLTHRAQRAESELTDLQAFLSQLLAAAAPAPSPECLLPITSPELPIGSLPLPIGPPSMPSGSSSLPLASPIPPIGPPSLPVSAPSVPIGPAYVSPSGSELLLPVGAIKTASAWLPASSSHPSPVSCWQLPTDAQTCTHMGTEPNGLKSPSPVIVQRQSADTDLAAASADGVAQMESTLMQDEGNLPAIMSVVEGESAERTASLRRLSAGTERRVHVSERLRQMFKESPIMSGLNLEVHGDGDVDMIAVELAMEEAGNWAIAY